MRKRHFSFAVACRFLAAVVVASAAAACSGVPSDVIQPAKMAQLLADIHIGESIVDQDRGRFNNDSVKQVLKQSIYQRNGVTVDEVNRSLAWYGRNIDRYSEVYNLTVEVLENRLAAVNEAAATNMEVRELLAFEAEGDSVDIWPLYRSRIFSPQMPNDRLGFEITNDRYWEKGDVYRLRFKLINPRHGFNVAMAAEYTDGRVSYVGTRPSADGWHTVELALDPDRTGSLLTGFIAYPTDSVLDRFPTVHTMIDSIQLVRLRRGVAGPVGQGEGRQHEISLR